MTTLLIDTEEGSGSVADEIEAGLVTPLVLKSYNEVEAKVFELLRGKREELPGRLGLDSISNLAYRCQEDIRSFGADMANPGAVWAQVAKKDGLDMSQPEWGKMSSAMIRLLWHMEALGIPVLFTAGEQLRDDGPQQSMIIGPDLNPMLRNQVIRYMDCVGRLGTLPGPAKLKDLDGQAKEYPAGTRVLRLAQNADYRAKCRVRTSRWQSGKFTETLANPTLERLQKNLGHMPHKTLIYGDAGVGKTTLICSGKDSE